MSPGNTPLANLAVIFSQSGMPQLAQALSNLQGSLGGVTQALNTIGQNAAFAQQTGAIGKALASLQPSFDALQKSAQTLSLGMATAFGFLLAKVEGFVRAGVMASTTGDVLNYQMSELARQVASLFVPAFEKLSALLQRVIDWFQSLSGEQQDQLAFWLELAAGALAVSAILPRVLASFAALGITLKAVGAGLLALATNPLVAIAVAVGAVVAALLPWQKILTALQDGFRRVWDALKESGVLDRLQALFSRLGEAIQPFVDVFLRGLNLIVEALVRLIDFLGRVQKGLDDITAKAWKAAEELTGGVFSEANFDKAHKILVEGLTTGVFNQLTNPLAPTPTIPAANRDQKKDRHEVLPHVSGFASLDASYQRIAEASIKATGGGNAKTTAEQQLEAEEAIRDYIRDLWQRWMPNVVPGEA